MSAATMSVPARQPFGLVSDARLRNLGNVKNKQNAIPASPSTAVKRSAPAEFDDIDTENIDPIQFFSGSNKKVKAFNFDPKALVKAPAFTLTRAEPAFKPLNVRSFAGQKRKDHDVVAAPVPKRPEPSPALVPAGRSPVKPKSKGILSRRRQAGNPLTRVDPPSFGKSAGLPFSIDAALAGTVPGKTNLKSKTKKTTEKGWSFEIHEDTPEEELNNIFNHSTSTLDISDDEGAASPLKGDRDNKENVAPADYEASGNASPTARRDMMTEEVRSPLGDLDTVAYFGTGCDASSIEVVPTDDFPEEMLNAKVADPTVSAIAMTDGVAKVKTCDKSPISSEVDEVQDDADKASAIQIWESESAKADDDDVLDNEAVPEQQVDSVAVTA